jgi:hypothetical protein
LVPGTSTAAGAPGAERGAGAAEAQEDDASVGLLTPKDELAKVAVVSDEGTLLGKSQPKRCPVGQPCWIIAADPGRVVTALSEELDEARIRTLIQ